MSGLFHSRETDDESHSTPLLSFTESGSKENNTCLSPSLRILFALGGATLSLPTIALLYIVNTRASIPVSLLSAYGALAFLPSSLKPLYACLSRHVVRRDWLLSLLLALAGSTVSLTALVPKNGVVCCFVLAFLRGVTIAWPEFLLDLTLIDQAQHRSSTSSSFEELAAVFQSQAATCRNVGSLFANVVSFLMFALRQQYIATGDAIVLSDSVVTFLLLLSGALSLVGAILALSLKVGLAEHETLELNSNQEEEERSGTYQYYDETDTCRDCVHPLHRECDHLLSFNNGRHEDSEHSVSPPSVASHATGSHSCWSLGNDITLVVVFQVTVIVFALRNPIMMVVGLITWSVIMAWLVLALVASALAIQWEASHRRVGAFLILIHAVPKTVLQMTSFVYWLFQSSPVFLQILSLVNMSATALASWSFGKVFAKYSVGWRLFCVFAITTVFASLVSLSNIILIRLDNDRDRPDLVLFLVVILVSAATTFANEWRFLPSVVLATTSVTGVGSIADSALPNQVADDPCGPKREPQHASGQEQSLSNRDTVGLEYGTFVSCIDFGDQIGAWLMMPLISALGISRETNWMNLNVLVLLGASGSLLSLVFLFLLGRPKA